MPHQALLAITSLGAVSILLLLTLLTGIVVLVLTAARRQVASVKQQWANTFDSIDDPILVHDLQGKIIRVNEAFRYRAQLLRQSLNAQTVFDLLRQGDAPWTICPYCEGFAGKGNEVDPALGGFLLASNSHFHDADGESLGVIHVLQDITDRHRAEERYQTLVENVQEGVFIATPEGRFLHVNEAFLEMLGYESREALMGVEDIGSAIYPDPAAREQLKKELREQGSVANFEYQVRRKSGEIRTVLESSFVTRDATGAVTAYQGVVLDITERNRSEQEIRGRNRELVVLNAISQVLNQPWEMPELLGRVLRELIDLFGADQAAIYLLGRETNLLTRASAITLDLGSMRPFPPAPIPDDFLAQIMDARVAVLSESGLISPRIFRSLGEQEGILSSETAVLWASERPAGFLTMGFRRERDVSATELNFLKTVSSQIAITVEKMQLHEKTREAYENLRQAQEQLLQSEKMAALGQLIAGVAHELNNPLTAILGYGELLSSQEMASPQAADYVRKLYAQAQRSHRITHNLLSFARQHKPERRRITLNQVVEDTLALREYDLRVNDIVLHRQFASDLPQILGDAHQLQQVFLNILNNAVDAVMELPSRRELWVRTVAQGDQLVVEVTDSGKGIKDLARVFDPFYTTKPIGKGTGLGLAICYGIVAAHGGEISARNAPSRGACFAVSLPLVPRLTPLSRGEPSKEVSAASQ